MKMQPGLERGLWHREILRAYSRIRRCEMEQSATNNALPIIGTWKLISWERHSSHGEVTRPFGENPYGLLIYTETGYMSAQIMRPERPQFASGELFEGTAEQFEASYRGLVSYYGHVEYDSVNSFVLHHAEGSWFPNWEGQPQKRFFELSGNHLTLTTAPNMQRGQEGFGVLIWERIE